MVFIITQETKLFCNQRKKLVLNTVQQNFKLFIKKSFFTDANKKLIFLDT